MVARAADVSEMYERICICRERESERAKQGKAQHSQANEVFPKCCMLQSLSLVFGRRGFRGDGQMFDD